MILAQCWVMMEVQVGFSLEVTFELKHKEWVDFRVVKKGKGDPGQSSHGSKGQEGLKCMTFEWLVEARADTTASAGQRRATEGRSSFG